MRLENIQILLADGNSTVIALLRRFLREMGLFSVESVTTGYAALLAMKKSHFDLLLVDWDIPKLGVLEMVKSLNHVPHFEPPRVILMLGHSNPNALEKASEMGLTQCLVKPFTAQTLKDTIEKV